jgi:hypothetical protein
MKRLRILSFSFVCLSLILGVLFLFNIQPISPVFATNAVTNPGFETGTTSGWSLESGSVTVRSDDYHSGSYSVASAYNGSYYLAFMLTQKLLINSNTVTSVSCWYNIGVDSTDYFKINYTDGSSTNTSLPNLGSWTQKTLTVTTGKTLDSVILVRTSSSATAVLIDDVVVDYNLGNAPIINPIDIPLSTVYAYQQFNVTTVLNDVDGAYNATYGLRNCTVDILQVSGLAHLYLNWFASSNSTTITDSHNWSNLVTSYTTTVNSTAVKVYWTLQLYWNTTNLYSWYAQDTTSVVYDQADLSANPTNLDSFPFVRELIVAASPTVNVTRCNPSSSAKFSGQLYYQGTSTAPYSATGITTYCALNGTQKGSNSSIASDGTFQITITAEASPIGTYTYLLYSQTDAGTSTTNRTKSFIVDSLNVTISANSTNPDTGQYVNFTVTATYTSDGSPVSSWTVNILRNSTYFATGNFTDHSVVDATYLYTTENASESTYGLTTFSSNTVTVVWTTQSVEIDQISTSDTRLDTGIASSSYYHSRWSGNLSDCISGIIYVNSTGFSINSTGWATVTFTFGTVGIRDLYVTGVNVSGITSYSQLPSDPQIIWDKALVQSGGIGSTYSHVGDSIQVYYVVKYEYDLSLITDGNVLLNGSAMTYNPLNVRWERTVSSAVLGNQSWIITAINSNAYGITVINDAVGTETCLYYANLNLRTIDVDSNVLTQAVVYMNNGTTGIPSGLPSGSGYAIVGPVSWSYQTVSSLGWANWTGMTNGTLQIYVKWYSLTVNSTFTLTMTNDTTLDLACLCYPFTVSSVQYWATSNATVTSKLYVANILTLYFSSSVDNYLLVSSCVYQPKYITNVTYDYSTDFLLGYLTLYHYGNSTLKLSYEGWGDLYVQKTDKLISAASLIGTNLTVSFMGSLGEIGNVYVYCGSRGGPAETGGFTTTSFIGGVLLGTYTFPSSSAHLWMSWATTYGGPIYSYNVPTSLVLVVDLSFPRSALPGQILTGILNVTWKGFPKIYVWSMVLEGTDYKTWLLTLPEGLPKELSASNQTMSLLAQLKIPANVGLGQTEIPCLLTFSTSQGSTKVFRVMVSLNIIVPSANVPDVLTFVFLGLLGSVIGVGLFAGERRRRKKASSS